MSEITLLDAVENLKKKYQLNDYQWKKCAEYFSVIKPGEFIYPGHLKSILCIDIKSAYFFMEDLKKQGYVRNIYEVYCMNCNKSKGIFIDALTDFDSDSACDFCNKSLSPTEDIIVLYKVIHI